MNLVKILGAAAMPPMDTTLVVPDKPCGLPISLQVHRAAGREHEPYFWYVTGLREVVQEWADHLARDYDPAIQARRLRLLNREIEDLQALVRERLAEVER